ncbi:MAG TPA: TonB-dependent receptor [Pseudomonadales bacterium]
MKGNDRRWLGWLGIAAGTLVTPQWALAAAPDSRLLEEVIVTAQRREQSLQDVPVSVGVVTGETIRELAIQNLDQLSRYVPGLSIQEGGEQTGISVRGFGAGLNFGFDQSVGLFIDGVYAGRERQFRSQFLDIGRVEVLRGPQSTLFGKNTTSGAVVITTGEPTQEFGADVRVEATPSVDGQRYEAILNGGITETLAGRLALRYAEDDGYMRNHFTGEEEEQEKDWIARATLLWTPTDALSVRTKVEYSEYERSGRAFNISNVSGLAVGKPLASGADVSAAAQLPTYEAYAAAGAIPTFVYGDLKRNSKQAESADVEALNAVIKIEYGLPNGATLTSITGYSGYESEDGRDVDWSPTNFLFEPISQEFDQYSQELTYASELGQKFDYMVGVHAFRNDFLVDRRTDINIEPFLLGFGVTPFSETIFGGPASAWRRGQLRFLDQQTTNASIFAQGTYRFTERWSLTAGVRYTWEKKEADDRYFLSQFGNDQFLELDPAVIQFFLDNEGLSLDTPEAVAARAELIALAEAAGGDNLTVATTCAFAVSQCTQIDDIVDAGRFGRGQEVKEEDVSPEATLTFDQSDNAMYYAKVTRGYKGGGFNSQATGSDSDPTFEDETVTGLELGSKLRLLDGRANLNAALFRMEFKNLQTSVWTGTEFDVKNAGKARSQGLELDGTWLATDRLQINGSMIWLDARYIDFDNAACSVPQQAFGEPGCDYFVGDSGAGVQDLSGKRFAPLFSGTLGLGYVLGLPGNRELLLRADFQYFAEQENPRDPTIAQGSRTNLDLAATLRPVSGVGWSLGLLVQNATDEEDYFYEFEAPSQIGTRIGFPVPPRMVTLRASYSL